MTSPPPVPGEEWARGADGVPERHAARVLLLDEQGRVLLVRGHDAHQPERTWWFTVGGGIDEGEDAIDAAVREVREETGIVLERSEVIGPLARRTGVFDFLARTVRQYETFYLARLVGEHVLTREGWTDVERSFMDEMAWWHPDDLERVSVEVFPAALAPLVRSVSDGWDGTVADLGHEDEGSAA